jgi:hypothetical protein
MTLSTVARHRLDRVLLVLTALAVLMLIGLSTAAAGGSGRVIVRTCLGLLIVAQIWPWLARQRTAHPENVAGAAAFAAFIGSMFLLTHPAMDGPVTLIGRLVVLFGIPVLVAWKLDPDSFSKIWRDYRAKYPRPTPRIQPTDPR